MNPYRHGRTGNHYRLARCNERSHVTTRLDRQMPESRGRLLIDYAALLSNWDRVSTAVRSFS